MLSSSTLCKPLGRLNVASSNDNMCIAEAVESFSIVILLNFVILMSVSLLKTLLPAVLQSHQMKPYRSKVTRIAAYAGFGQC